MKYILMTLALFFVSVNAFSITEEELSDRQRAKVYEIMSEYKKQYPPEEKKTVVRPSAEMALATEVSDKIKDVIAGIRAFYEEVKGPTQDFLETDLAKYVGIIIFFNFFGVAVGEYILGIVFLFFAYRYLMVYRDFMLASFGEVVSKTVETKKGKVVYQKVVLEKNSPYHVIHKILLCAWFLTAILFVF